MSDGIKRASENALNTVNHRLRKGEGWIGYRYAQKDSPSKFLYYSFYRDGKQVFVNTKTNDAEAAYRQLLVARNAVEQGNRTLPSDVAKLKYEDLRELLMEHYREEFPASIYTRKNDEGDAEQTFLGADKLDSFFKNSPVNRITTEKLRQYRDWRRREGDADATIRRQLGRLRTAFNLAEAQSKLTRNVIPYFPLPRDSAPREGFIDFENFEKLLKALPAHLRLGVEFLYYSGSRVGAAKQITWSMVSADNTEIQMPGRIIKNRRPHVVNLVGPLEHFSKELAKGRKSFPKPIDFVFDFRNLRNLWNETCAKLGLGKYDAKTRKYEGLLVHDLRRSAARNLIKAGVSRTIAKKITGHKTDEMFDRYGIQENSDVKDAMIKVGQFKRADVLPIAENSASR